MGAGGAGGPDWGRVGVRGPRCALGRDRTLGIEPTDSNPRDRTHGIEPTGSNSLARVWGGFMGRGGCLGQPRALRCSCNMLCYVMLCKTGICCTRGESPNASGKPEGAFFESFFRSAFLVILLKKASFKAGWLQQHLKSPRCFRAVRGSLGEL